MTDNVYQQAATEDAGEPLAGDPMTASEMTEIDPEHLEKLGYALSMRRTEWVNARRASGVEKRWMEDIDQYNGKDASSAGAISMMETVEAGGFPSSGDESKPSRSTVFVNITRPKTNAAEARLANMLLPTDDRNWGIKPSPDPKLTSAAMEEVKAMAAQQAQAAQQPAAPGVAPMPGAPGALQPPAPTPMVSAMAGAGVMAQPALTAQARIDEAVKRSKAMQDHIDDQLVGCDYNGQLRMLIHDAALIGTGILKGPIVVNRVRKAWTPKTDANRTVHVLEIVEEKSPASERVDPWDCFPDPACGENVHNGRGMFEKKNVTSKQLRELVGQPGYIEANISKVLQEGPKTATSQTQRDAQKKSENGASLIAGELYELWEYWGEFSPEDLRSAGVDVPDGATSTVSGCIVMVNNHVIKGFLNPIETGDMPYDFMVWEKVDGSVWGIGLPRVMNSAQRVLNAAWRQLMDNAGLSVGPQIVVNPMLVQPADKKWEITGRKLWFLNDIQASAKDAFSSVDIPNNVEEIKLIVEMAEKFLDDESGIPTMMQGEKGTAPETLGGMQLLMNSSNVVLGRMVKQFDDSITRPHIRRYYDWNMCYDDNDEIKGDFQVDARGSSALLVKDIQSQALLALGQYSGNGVIAGMVDWKEWFKAVLKSQHIDATGIMKTDAEIASMQAQPPQATPEQIRANAQLAVAQTRAAAVKEVADAKVHGELAYADKMLLIEHQNAAARAQERQDELQLAMLKYAHDNKQTLDQIRADLAKTSMQEQTKRELAAVDAQLQQNQHHANLAVDVHKHNTGRIDAAQQAAMQPEPAPEGMPQ